MLSKLTFMRLAAWAVAGSDARARVFRVRRCFCMVCFWRGVVFRQNEQNGEE